MLITVATLHVGERDLAVMERAAWMSMVMPSVTAERIRTGSNQMKNLLSKSKIHTLFTIALHDLATQITNVIPLRSHISTEAIVCVPGGWS